MATARRTARIAIGSVALVSVLALGACSSDEPDADTTTSSESTTTAPIPEPGGVAVSTLDLCERFGADATTFLAAVGADDVVTTQGDTSELAAVCGWFLADPAGDRPPNLLLRVEPVREEGNFLCEERPEVPSEPLELEDGPDAWISTGKPVEAAAEGRDWCVYARAPEPIEPSEDVTAAMAELLASMERQLPS
jgi:hypothetical protein